MRNALNPLSRKRSLLLVSSGGMYLSQTLLPTVLLHVEHIQVDTDTGGTSSNIAHIEHTSVPPAHKSLHILIPQFTFDNSQLAPKF